MDEDAEEDDLDCEGEMNPESPPHWNDYEADEIYDGETEEINEDTALLQRAIQTEIVITPMSPVSLSFNKIKMRLKYLICLGVSSSASFPMKFLRNWTNR